MSWIGVEDRRKCVDSGAYISKESSHKLTSSLREDTMLLDAIFKIQYLPELESGQNSSKTRTRVTLECWCTSFIRFIRSHGRGLTSTHAHYNRES